LYKALNKDSTSTTMADSDISKKQESTRCTINQSRFDPINLSSFSDEQNEQ